MEFVCPQTCPKNMRNGPCGGTKNGQCEVVDKPCIWTAVFERAKSANHLEDLKVYIPPPIRTLKGTSSWVNFFLGRDSRPRNVSAPPLAIGSILQQETSEAEQRSSPTKKLTATDPEVRDGKIGRDRP
jgi:hypothetical protein